MNIDHGGSSLTELYTNKDWIDVHFYSSVFQDLIAGGYVSPKSKSLCVETPTGRDVFTLREIDVRNVVVISKKATKPLVKPETSDWIPFGDDAFDFVFSDEDSFARSAKPAEIGQTLKPSGFNSFLDLFNCFRVVKKQG